ncbi:MAG: cytochrome b [Fluviicola sp.]|jgi:heme A synthase|nr:cytochrome b [Fluviicola sp.]
MLVHAHSGLRWLALALLVFAIVKAFAGIRSGKYEKSNKMVNLFAMVLLHIQVTLGTILTFSSGKMSYAEGWMKNPQYRFFGLEHILLMVLAAVLLTIGRKKAEKLEDLSKRNKTIAIWYTIALVLILAGIPWPFREILGAKWF